MSVLVADTSSLVSLGHAAGNDPDPLELVVEDYDVHLPVRVEAELREVASYDDADTRAAKAALAALGASTVDPVDLDESFPLDEGENAAVTLANDVDADLLLCDEFNRIGLVHASLAGPRLVTTPTLLIAFARRGRWTASDAEAVLSIVESERSWETNSYVRRARDVLDGV